MAHEVKHIVLADEVFVSLGMYIIIYKLAGYALNGKLAGRIYLGQHHVVEQRETVGKLAVEVTSAGVKVGLEDGCYLAAAKDLPKREDAVSDLLGVVGIVAQHYVMIVFHSKVEASLHALKRGHRPAQFIGLGTGQLGQGQGCDTILYIDAHGHTEADAVDITQGRFIVKDYLATSDYLIFCMEIALAAPVAIDRNTPTGTGLHLEAGVEDECPTLLH